MEVQAHKLQIFLLVGILLTSLAILGSCMQTFLVSSEVSEPHISLLLFYERICIFFFSMVDVCHAVFRNRSKASSFPRAFWEKLSFSLSGWV